MSGTVCMAQQRGTVFCVPALPLCMYGPLCVCVCVCVCTGHEIEVIHQQYPADIAVFKRCRLEFAEGIKLLQENGFPDVSSAGTMHRSNPHISASELQLLVFRMTPPGVWNMRTIATKLFSHV